MKRNILAITLASLAAMALSSCTFDFPIFGGSSSDAVETSFDNPIGKTEIRQTYADYCDNMIYDCPDTPTEGDVKLLVIPVWLTDSSRYITYKDNVRADIETAYFGTEEETGWQSVATYYHEESQGKLTLGGVVTEWYDANISTRTLGQYDTEQTNNLVVAASDWYFEENPSESRQDYDYDGDGYLDGIILVYGAPNYMTLSNSTYSNLWAYTYWVQGYNSNPNNPVANAYFFSSYDFLYDGRTALSRAGTSYGYGDCSHLEVDAHTFIHEMGHLFGLQDYYDYSGQYTPGGGFSMQDYNVGGHDPYSLMALGWANPYIVTDSSTITISAFTESHDLVLLTPEWNGYDSAFDEYILLELYSPTGLNEFDCDYHYDGSYQGPEDTGIRVWHVDSRLAQATVRGNSYEFLGELTSDASESFLNLAMSNTYWERGGSNDYCSVLGQEYADYNILQLIRNSSRGSYRPSDAFSGNNLFRDGSTFAMQYYSGQFVNGTLLNNGKSLDYAVDISISGSGASASATLEITKF